MSKIKTNIIKGWATTVIGVATMVISLVLVWQKVFDFVWEGIGGLTIGAILLLAPKTIEKIVLEGVKSWGKRGQSYDPYAPTVDPNQPIETLKEDNGNTQ